MPNWSSRPFRRSFEALARLGLQETNASGFVFFERDPSGARVLLAGHGATDLFSSWNEPSLLVEYPLRHNNAQAASLAFAFATQEAAAAARPALDRIATAVELLWRVGPTEVYQSLLERLAEIEMKLIDSKIADRVRGILSDPARSGSAETMARHVEGILRPSHARLSLEQILTELEEEMEERRLVAEAKRCLQAKRGITEEQAHAELRMISRKSRQKLRDVALQIIDRQQIPKGKTA